MAKRKKKKTKAWDGLDISGLVLIALGILTFIGIISGENSWINKVVGFTFAGLFGVGTYILPIVFIVVGILLIMVKKPKFHMGKISLSTMLVLSVLGMIHIVYFWLGKTVGVYNTSSAVQCFNYGEALKQAFKAGQESMTGMGVLAALYVYPISSLFTSVGAFVVFIVLSVIALTVLFNLSLREAGEKVGQTVKHTGQKMQKSFADASVRRREAREKRKNYDYIIDDDEEDAEKEKVKKHKVEKEDTDEQYDDFELETTEFIEKDRFTDKNENNIPEQFEVSAVESKKRDTVVPIIDEEEETDDDLILETETQEEVTPEEDEPFIEAEDDEDNEGVYSPPPITLLNPPPAGKNENNGDHSEQIEMMESTLKSFGINAWVENITVGPAVTRYELSIERGTRVSKILNLSDDIALSMAAVGVRIEAPIPGKSAIGIEIPNKSVTMVTLREVLESDTFKNHKSPVAVGLGKDITGSVIVADLAKMPHMLIAGQTGAGKSVCINTIIMSLLYKSSPKEVKLILVDPKKVEFNVYDGDPHLMTPVVTDPKKAAGALQFVVREMEKRYESFARRKVKDIVRYNEVCRENHEEEMPRIVVIVDELNDLMLVARGEVEDSVMRIAQLARAAGIYLILATQRPSVNVITGVIKANIPSRIAFAVASGIDSKTILDGPGAEKLVGKGDMLFHANGEPKPKRVQGAFVSEQEAERVVEFIKKKNIEAKYIDESQIVLREMKPNHGGSGENPNDAPEESGEDDLFPGAVEYAIQQGSISVSALQRHFKVGYARAGRLIDTMEAKGIVEPPQGAKARRVLMTTEEFWSMYDERLD